MTQIARPVPNARRVAPGDRLRVADVNTAASAIAALQTARNALFSASGRPWAETMTHRIAAIFDDYLECVRVWSASDGTETVYVARPALLRASLASRDGVSYVYSDAQTRTASKAGESDETQIVTPNYLVGDVIEVQVIRGRTGITVVDQQRGRPIDKNVDGRAWAAVPP